jgi:pimeloyl-ACP methyl ester carboxylesterase
MKTLKILTKTLSYILSLGILIFALATFFSKAYEQTIVFVLIAISIVYWPKAIRNKWNHKIYIFSRLGFIILLIAIKVLFMKGEPMTSIYISEEKKANLMEEYESLQSRWPENTEEICIQSPYGKVYVLVCGAEENPPIMLIHAASMGAHSWAENLEPLLKKYRVYSFDNIGEGNKSELDNPLKYPNTSQEIADLYAMLADSLGIEKSPVFGSSNGGYISMCYAYHYPERVEKLGLFGPMGLTPLSNKSIMMLSIATLYPLDFVKNKVTEWAFGDDEYVLNTYGNWFNTIMSGTIPSVSKPIPMTTEQKKEMDMPVLLFLGTNDPIVGDVNIAKQEGMEYPNIQIEVVESGHLVAVEHRDYVNQKIEEFMEKY